MVNLNELSPPEWCDGDALRNTDQPPGTCANAFTVYEGLWHACYHNAAAGKCQSTHVGVDCGGAGTGVAAALVSLAPHRIAATQQADQLPQPMPLSDALSGDLSSGEDGGAETAAVIHSRLVLITAVAIGILLLAAMSLACCAASRLPYSPGQNVACIPWRKRLCQGSPSSNPNPEDPTPMQTSSNI